ncbi:LLM class flavin-dependent oxidoreductase [Pseudomonas sp. CCC3.1]|uniref:LLM class flavin-dependent oxidoreductase n=1 Tax=Pseudomonas sp. CCC3.1 TaxID=3048607 RepID=UPI002AC9A4CA|nr:LLM class flavin-dependent oxidoreductase [Pseudomonas sp. CCC3.1]MEB0205969.1 LLM class flavin-dependent oxidoreductase [Pseudomonas sp. CCC3.1]WPX38370.1 LLM class flavin-dependent oxidoreductase [Pseudomonas sp. CCC3.1]
MEFGTFILAAQRGYHQTSEHVIRHSIEQAIASEKAGFHTAWFAEHHFNNYSLVPSPLMMVAALSGLTRTIRLGTAVCVLPLYQPQRLLSEIGFADIVSNGRLELGVGSGYQQFEFERFGVDVNNAPQVFSEYLDILQKGLKQPIFEHDGEHLKIPPTAISVRTVQQPGPPIWLAAGSPRSMARAYREGHNLFVTAFHDGLETVQTLRESLESAAASEGKQVTDARVALLRCCFASDNESEINSYLDNARYQRRLSEALQKRRQQSSDGYLMQEMPTEKDLSFEQMRKNMPIGSVNYVIDKLLEEIEVLKPDQIAVQTQLGDFDEKTMLRQIEVWGETIIPAVNKALASSGRTIVPA